MTNFNNLIVNKLNHSEMKKALAIVALIAAMFVAGNVQAQTTINVGYAPETFSYDNSSHKLQGFYAGLTQNIGLYKGIGVAVGAQFRMNTKNESTTIMGVTTTGKENQFLIDVPILINYGITVDPDIIITPFAGPMLTLALAGNTKYYIGSSISRTDNWYGDDGDRNRFNLNAVFGANVKFDQLNLHGGYRIGLIDQIKSDNGTMNTSGFFVGLGYNL